MADFTEELFFSTIPEWNAKLKSKQISALELTRAFSARLEKLGPRYNALALPLTEKAIKKAKSVDDAIKRDRLRSPLIGIPFGAKDLLSLAGAPTTWGAKPYAGQVFDEDAAALKKLDKAGAVLIGKLAMVQLAGGGGYRYAAASLTGPGLNPWDRTCWSGGSSSGPGSAVAAGLVPFAIGSETSGSILTPSAFSGVTGLRPTYGLVSRHGAMALCWTLDKLGPMGRSADDCALVLSAIAGRDPADESTVDRGFDYGEPAKIDKRPRLAIPKGVTEKVQPDVRENFNRAIDVLKPVADITTDVEWPDFPWGPAVSAIVGAEGASAFLDLIESGRVKELSCPRDRRGGYAATLIPAVDYLHAMRLRRPMKRAVAELFKRFDAVVSPTRASVAYPVTKNFEDAYPNVDGGPPLIAAGNLCGLPALCVPTGLGENKLPTSMAFMGPAYSERALVALGAHYQSKTGWHLERPPGV